MVRSTRRIRIVGSGGDVHLRASGDWESEPLKGLREAWDRLGLVIASNSGLRASVPSAGDT